MAETYSVFQKTLILGVVGFSIAIGCSQREAVNQTMNETELRRQFLAALEGDDVKLCEALLDKHPSLLTMTGVISPSLLNDVVSSGKTEFVQMFLDRGFSLSQNPNGKKIFLMSSALIKKKFDMAKWLLEKGCDPNRGRLLISSINLDKRDLDWVKLFVEHGADVNWCVRIAGPEVEFATPLDWARGAEKQEIVDYLLSKGALSSDDPNVVRRTDD